MKNRIIGALNLEDTIPEEVDENAPLSDNDSGLDSIDVLELIVLLDKYYGICLNDPKEGEKISEPVTFTVQYTTTHRTK